LILISESGCWGEELIGPLDQFDAAGYQVDFCTPTRKRPNAIPVSWEPESVDPPLNRPVTTDSIAKKMLDLDDPKSPQGKRLENPINLAERLITAAARLDALYKGSDAGRRNAEIGNPRGKHHERIPRRKIGKPAAEVAWLGGCGQPITIFPDFDKFRDS